MRLKSAIISLLFTFIVLVNTMDNPNRDRKNSNFKSFKSKLNFLEKGKTVLSAIKNKVSPNSAPKILTIKSSDNPSTSTEIKNNLPYLVSPDMDRHLTSKYTAVIISLRKKNMPELAINNVIQETSKNLYQQIVELYFIMDKINRRIEGYPNELKDTFDWRTRQKSELASHRAKLLKLTGEYNWLQERYLRKPEDQIGVSGRRYYDRVKRKRFIRIEKSDYVGQFVSPVYSPDRNA